MQPQPPPSPPLQLLLTVHPPTSLSQPLFPRLQDMQLLAERFILSALREGGLLRGDLAVMLDARVGALFMPHGEQRGRGCLQAPAGGRRLPTGSHGDDIAAAAPSGRHSSCAALAAAAGPLRLILLQ